MNDVTTNVIQPVPPEALSASSNNILSNISTTISVPVMQESQMQMDMWPIGISTYIGIG